MEKSISDNGQYREVLTDPMLTMPFHQELIQLYNMYALIGGMPEVDLKKSPKLFWFDTGLVNYSAGIQREYLLSKDLMDTWRGAAAEQIVAQELRALSHDAGSKLNYWMRNKRGSSAEVDLI